MRSAFKSHRAGDDGECRTLSTVKPDEVSAWRTDSMQRDHTMFLM
jgi:hypothetical protein